MVFCATVFLVATIIYGIAYSIPGFYESAILKGSHELAEGFAAEVTVGQSLDDLILVSYLMIMAVLEYRKSFWSNYFHLTYIGSILTYWFPRKLVALSICGKLQMPLGFIMSFYVSNGLQTCCLTVTFLASLLCFFFRWSQISCKQTNCFHWTLFITNSFTSLFHLVPWMTGNLVFYYGGGNCHPSIPGFRLITEDSSYRSVPVFLSMFVGLMLSVRLLRPCRPTDATIKQFDDLSMVVITGMMLGICTLDQISKIAGYSATVDRTSHVDHDRASSAACMQGFLILNILSHLLALGGLVTVGYFLTRSLRKRSRVSESYYPVSV